MRTRRWAGASIAALSLALGLTGTALATPPLMLDRNAPLAFSFVDSEICPGIDVVTTFEGKRNATLYVDTDGNELRLVINVQYWGTFTNAAEPGLTVRSPGHRHITFDFVANTFTDIGVYRNVTVQGSGTIHAQAGRLVETLDEGILLAVSGPHQDYSGDFAAFCAALGG